MIIPIPTDIVPPDDASDVATGAAPAATTSRSIVAATPNPAHGRADVELCGRVGAEVRVESFDLLGTPVSRATTTLPASGRAWHALDMGCRRPERTLCGLSTLPGTFLFEEFCCNSGICLRLQGARRRNPDILPDPRNLRLRGFGSRGHFFLNTPINPIDSCDASPYYWSAVVRWIPPRDPLLKHNSAQSIARVPARGAHHVRWLNAPVAKLSTSMTALVVTM